MSFEVPADWIRITTIDAHTAGEPLRVITGGYPSLPGDTILAKRRHARTHHDHLRRALMLEPRGHADMYGCVLTEPTTPDGDVGVLFLHNEGYSTMCGHGIIALVKVGIEAGLLPHGPDRPFVAIDTPAGRVTARAHFADDGRVARVSFRNVPSFLAIRDAELLVPGLGTVHCDLAYGGAFYVYVAAADLDLSIAPDQITTLIDLGRRIKLAAQDQLEIRHPDGDPDLEFLYGTIFHSPRPAPDVHSRHCCIFADGEVDRSPTGTGVSARAAILHARGELDLAIPITIDSILGTRFEVAIAEPIQLGDVAAIIPEVTGTAHTTGRHEFWIDPTDPLATGFLLR